MINEKQNAHTHTHALHREIVIESQSLKYLFQYKLAYLLIMIRKKLGISKQLPLKSQTYAYQEREQEREREIVYLAILKRLGRFTLLSFQGRPKKPSTSTERQIEKHGMRRIGRDENKLGDHFKMRGR